MKLKGKHKLVFSVGDDGCIITCFLGDTLIKRVFAINPLSPEFEEITSAYPKAEIYVLLDNIDQTFNMALIPPVGGSYRKKIINRKILSEFDKNDINTYIKVGREENGRKDWKYVFISVRNGAPISDWIDAILEIPNKLGGIYLFPLESIDFIKKLRVLSQKEQTEKKNPRWEILVSHNRVGGIRQVVLKDNNFVFTRISQLNHSNQDIQSLAAYISQETNNTLEYIRRIGYNEQEDLNIYFVTSKDVSKEIEVVESPSVKVYSFYPYMIANEMGFKAVAQESDRFCDVVFAANFINTKKKSLKIDTAKSLQITKLNSGIMAVKVISSILAVGFLFGIGYSLLTMFTQNIQSNTLDGQISSARAKLADSKDFEAEYKVRPENLIELVRFDDENEKRDEKLFDILTKISNSDLHGSKVAKITYNKNDAGYTLVMEFEFQIINGKTISDLIIETDTFNTTMHTALKNYQIMITGLPSERKEFKVDESSTSDNNIKIVLTVTGA